MDKKALRAKLDAIAKEHKRDLTDPTYQFVVENAIMTVSIAESLGIPYEIVGANSGDGFFEFEIRLHKKSS